MKGKIINENIEKSQYKDDLLYDFLEGENDITYHEYTYKLLDNDNGMIGGVCMTIFLNRMYIDQVIVLKKYRRQGYGEFMLKEIEEFAIARGVEVSNVGSYNFQAPEFYKKQGYRLVYTRVCKDSRLNHNLLQKNLTNIF